VAPATCIHGQAPGACEICRVLGTGPAPAHPVAPAGRAPARSRREGGPRLPSGATGLLVGGAGLLLAVVVVSQVVAAAWAVFKLLQLVAVAAVSGWVGYRVGLMAGRRR
jgi:cobalamin biosynthesis protein CobD/CbiB